MSELFEGFSATGVDLPADLSNEGMLVVGNFIRRAQRGWQWWLADLLIWADDHGQEDRCIQMLADLGFQAKEHRLDNKKWVGRRFPRERRRDTLSISFSHHEAVASLEPEEQDQLLDRAEVDKLNREQFREEVRHFQAKTASPERPAPPPPRPGRAPTNRTAPQERAERNITMEQPEKVNLLEVCLESDDGIENYRRVWKTEGATPDQIYTAAVNAKDLILSVMETCERLGVEPA